MRGCAPSMREASPRTRDGDKSLHCCADFVAPNTTKRRARPAHAPARFGHLCHIVYAMHRRAIPRTPPGRCSKPIEQACATAKCTKNRQTQSAKTP